MKRIRDLQFQCQEMSKLEAGFHCLYNNLTVPFGRDVDEIQPVKSGTETIGLV